MDCLIIANAIQSSKTSRYWARKKKYILNCFSNAEVIIPDGLLPKRVLANKEYDCIILIGDDKFFNSIINQIFPIPSTAEKKNLLALIPDRRNSAIANSLYLPNDLKSILDLIKKKQYIPIDVIRCHLINKRGFPDDFIVINDVLIGIPELKLPLALRTLASIAKTPLALSSENRLKTIQLLSNGDEIYNGSYVFSTILLGNKLSNGPKIHSRRRINANCFEYYQLNSRKIKDLTGTLTHFLKGDEPINSSNLFREKFTELTVKGESIENYIVGDGIDMGRLPATFTLLSKAIKVISPSITVRIKQAWKNGIVQAKYPKPVGSRNSMKSTKDSSF